MHLVDDGAARTDHIVDRQRSFRLKEFDDLIRETSSLYVRTNSSMNCPTTLIRNVSLDISRNTSFKRLARASRGA